MTLRRSWHVFPFSTLLPHPSSLNDRPDSLLAFVVMWLCRFSMRCKCCTSWTLYSVSFNVRKEDVEESGINFSRSFNHDAWQWDPAPSLTTVTFLVSLNSGSSICREVPRIQIRRFPNIAQFLTRPTFVWHNPILDSPVRSWWSSKIPWIMRLAIDLTSSSPILRNQTSSPNYVINFLHLWLILLISLVFPCVSILILFMTYAAKRGSQLNIELSSIRTLVLPSWNSKISHCLFTCLTTISTRSLAMWSSRTILTESLPLLHMCASPHLGVLASLSHLNMIVRKSSSLMTSTRNEMHYVKGPFIDEKWYVMIQMNLLFFLFIFPITFANRHVSTSQKCVAQFV